MRRKIIFNKEISSGIFKMVFEWEGNALPGQFVMIGCGGDTLLKRPLSICNFEKGEMEIVYQIKGKGTYNLSMMKPGDLVDINGPFGHGFDVFKDKKNILIVGGGIGIPPLLYLARTLNAENINIALGFRDKTYLIDEFKKYGNVIVTTESGNYGIKGYVLDAISNIINNVDMIYGCGPKLMLIALKELSLKYNIPCQISVEERMGCGIGACMVCACKTKSKDGYHYKKVCKDGPVFWAEEVEF